jgi:hypothetical protein
MVFLEKLTNETEDSRRIVINKADRVYQPENAYYTMLSESTARLQTLTNSANHNPNVASPISNL